MFCLNRRHFALIAVVLATFFQSDQLRASDGIVWQTDLKKAYDQARKEKIPLVVYIYSADEHGPLPHCRSFESTTLSSREVAHYKDLALFVRVDTARDDDVGTVSQLTKGLNVTGVPCVTLCECRDDEILVRTPFFGDGVKSEFVSYFRSGILDKKLSIKLHGRPVCTEEEYVRKVDLFREEQQRLQKELSVADLARAKLLNNMRAQGGIRMVDLKAVDGERAQIQIRMVTLLTRFVELNAPEITEFCRLELEIHTAVAEAAVFLQEDLSILTIDGVLSGELAVETAVPMIVRSDEQLANELSTMITARDAAAAKIRLRISSLVGDGTAATPSVVRAPWLPPIGP